MLQAMTRNKARRYLIDRTSTRVPTEDIMSACVFGGLEYFPEPVKTNLLNAMLSAKIGKFSAVEEVVLWDREEIEPDVSITGLTEDGQSYTILIECKWAAPLDSEQIRRQAEKLRTLGVGKTEHLVVLRSSVGPDAAMFERLVQQGVKLTLLTWRVIGERLSNYALKNKNCWSHKWARDVSIVIEKAGFPPFRGWTQFTQATLPDLPIDRPLFWKNAS